MLSEKADGKMMKYLHRDNKMEIKRVRANLRGRCQTCSNRVKVNVWEVIGREVSFILCNDCMKKIRAMHFLYYGGED